MEVGDAVLKVSGDTKDVDQALAGMQSKTEKAMKKMQGSMRAAGVAFTAVGAAGLAMVSSARKMNAQLMQTGITIGATTKEMRDLALSTTNVTFPLESVTKTFELLARAGIKDQKILAASATAFDTLGDATGVSAEVVATQLIPAFKLFGLEIPKTAEELDNFTWLTKNTTVELAEFGSVMSYVAQFGDQLTLTLEDMVAIMAVLESKGKSGSTATKMFRTAVTQAAAGTTTLNDALGITNEEVAHFRDEMEEATGITQEYADAANTQFGIIDKLRHAWSTFTFRIGSMLQPLEGVLAVMTAIGPVMIIMSTQAGINAAKFVTSTIALIAHKLALIATTAAMVSMRVATAAFNLVLGASLGPIGLALTAIGLLVAAVYGVARAFGFLRKPIEELPRYTAESVNQVREQAEDMLKTISRATMDAADEERRILNERLENARGIHGDRIDLINEEYTAELRLLGLREGAEIAALQAEIDAIDEGLEARREGIQDEEDDARLASLEAASLLEKDADKREDIIKQRDKHLERMETTRLQREARAAKDALRAEIEGVRENFDKERDIAAERRDAAIEFQDGMLKLINDGIENARIVLEDKFKEDIRRIEDTTIAVQEAEAEKLLALHNRLREEYEAFRQFNADLEAMPPAILQAPIIPPPIGGGTTTPIIPFPPVGELGGLQHGGIVMRPMIAKLGEQAPRIKEAVIPLDGAHGLGGVTIIINEPVFRNEEDIDYMAEKMVDTIRLRQRTEI